MGLTYCRTCYQTLFSKHAQLSFSTCYQVMHTRRAIHCDLKHLSFSSVHVSIWRWVVTMSNVGMCSALVMCLVNRSSWVRSKAWVSYWMIIKTKVLSLFDLSCWLEVQQTNEKKKNKCGFKFLQNNCKTKYFNQITVKCIAHGIKCLTHILDQGSKTKKRYICFWYWIISQTEWKYVNELNK